MSRSTSPPRVLARAVAGWLFGCLLFGPACGSDSATDHIDDLDRPDAGAGPDGSAPVGDGGSPEPLTDCDEAKQHGDFAWLQEHVFTPSCATALCHAGPEPEVGLTLEAGKAYTNLVNKGASTVSGWTRVVPGSLAQSYLVVSLGRAEGPPPRDGFMPLGADPLCVEKLEAIERWILAGAPP